MNHLNRGCGDLWCKTLHVRLQTCRRINIGSVRYSSHMQISLTHVRTDKCPHLSLYYIISCKFRPPLLWLCEWAEQSGLLLTVLSQIKHLCLPPSPSPLYITGDQTTYDVGICFQSCLKWLMHDLLINSYQLDHFVGKQEEAIPSAVLFCWPFKRLRWHRTSRGECLAFQFFVQIHSGNSIWRRTQPWQLYDNYAHIENNFIENEITRM